MTYLSLRKLHTESRLPPPALQHGSSGPCAGVGGLEEETGDLDPRSMSSKPLINVNLFELSALCGVGSFVILIVQLVMMRKA